MPGHEPLSAHPWCQTIQPGEPQWDSLCRDRYNRDRLVELFGAFGPPMIFVLDNYDSFTYNLVQRFGEIDSTLEILVARNDQITLSEIHALKPDRILVSPGPCSPGEAGISKALILEFGPTGIPILGVCLGHQCMAEVYGAQVVRAKRLMHGKTSAIHHDGQGIFVGLPNPFTATRYHSLVVPEETLTPELIACGWTRDADHPSEIMAMRHARYPVHGVQFHPESFLTDSGIELLKNFLRLPHVGRVSYVPVLS